MNIILTGFMGTGKSTVGRAVAQQLDWPFVDMDMLIEEREERPIREIFAEQGEAYFRELETELCREISGWDRHVVSTGGGALVNPKNLSILVPRNLIICLDCQPEALWQRLSNATDRPLLDGEDKKAQLLAVLESRRAAYARIEHHIDTSQRSVQDIAAEIVERVSE